MLVFKLVDRMLLFGGMVVQVYVRSGQLSLLGVPLLTCVKLLFSTALILLGYYISEVQLREKNLREILQERHFREGRDVGWPSTILEFVSERILEANVRLATRSL